MTALLPGYPSETSFLYRRQPHPLSVEELGRVYNQPAMSSERYGSKPLYSPTDVYSHAHGGYIASPGSNEAGQLHPPPTMSTHYSPATAYSPTSREFPPCPTFSVPRVSENGMIVVRGYTPSEGEPNIPITVEVELHPDDGGARSLFGHRMPKDNLKLRLVLGCTAVKTTILRELPKPGEDETGIDRSILRLRLHGSAPLHSETLCDNSDVPLTIQAMDGTTDVVESFTFGSFTYWTAGEASVFIYAQSHAHS